MAHQHPDQPYSIAVGADLSANEFPAVIINTSGVLALPSAGGAIHGILDNAPDCSAAGKMGRIFWSGVLKAKAAGNITKGAKVSVVGSAGALGVSATQGHAYVGIALAAAAAGDIFTVFVQPGGFGAVP